MYPKKLDDKGGGDQTTNRERGLREREKKKKIQK